MPTDIFIPKLDFYPDEKIERFLVQPPMRTAPRYCTLVRYNPFNQRRELQEIVSVVHYTGFLGKKTQVFGLNDVNREYLGWVYTKDFQDIIADEVAKRDPLILIKE